MTTTDSSGRDGSGMDATAVLPAAGDPALLGETDSTGSDRPHRRTGKVVLEWGLLLFAAVAIAVLIKSFLFEAFYIPSQSMEPTLFTGDRILVNKLSYDFHDVNRGDVVVFEAPKSAQQDGVEDFVKRVIGLPGETVTYGDDGSVLVDGHPLHEPYLRDGVATTKLDEPVPPHCGAPASGEPGCVVPEDRVFVMGDNRTASRDGRVFGAIPQSSIIGRVFLRIWPIGDIGFF